MIANGFLRKLRILFLLFILFLVAGNAWLTKVRATDWDRPLRVVIYPINGDGIVETSAFIESLQKATFEPIEQFLKREAERYGLALNRPVAFYLAPEVHTIPPKAPGNGNVLKVMWWSLKMRYWAYGASAYDGPAPNIEIFVVYYDPLRHERLDHSLGLEKGLIGVVNAYTGEALAARNNVIIAHELLHTLGATDKYDLSDNQPLYPDGYAEPDRRPLFPQRKAEIMAGRIPLSSDRAVMPESLKQALIGDKTSREINWID